MATLVPGTGNEPPELGRPLAILWVRSGLRDVRQFEVCSRRVSIGRDSSNDVVLDTPAVGARHAMLSLAGGVWTLTSQGEGSNTWVDGVRLADSMPLTPGSEVRIAGVVLSFAPRDTWSDSAPPPSDRSAPALSGPLFLPPEETGPSRRPLVRAAAVLIVCFLAWLLLGVR